MHEPILRKISDRFARAGREEKGKKKITELKIMKKGESMQKLEQVLKFFAKIKNPSR